MDQKPDWLELYRLGLSDLDIARRVGTDRWTIGARRRRHGLSRNVGSMPVAPEEQARRLADYQLGLSDAQMAERWGIAYTTVKGWRTRQGLPCHSQSTRHDAGQRAARLLLYSFGYSDARIAREQRVTRGVVWRWRQRLMLEANNPRGTDARDRTAIGGHRSEDAVVARIKRALPAYLSPADRDDAAADLMLAVLDGTISIGDIERRAKTAGSRVFDQYASKWGTRSLDQEIGQDGDGFTLMDTLRDHSCSSWLEEMGATAW